MTITSRGSPDQVSDPSMTAADDWFPENRNQTQELWKRAVVELTSIGGTGDAITADAGIPLDAYALGQMWSLVPTDGNTGAVTIDIDGKGARNVKRSDGSALSAGDLIASSMYLLRDTGAALRVVSPLGSPGASTQTHMVLAFEMATGTDGGTATAAARQVFPLNTEILNTIVGASFDDTSHQLELPGGTYKVDGRASFHNDVQATAIYLHNVTDDVDVTTGIARSQGWQAGAHLAGVFVLAASKTLELEYSVGNTDTTDGLGGALDDDDGAPEQYGFLMLTKIG